MSSSSLNAFVTWSTYWQQQISFPIPLHLEAFRVSVTHLEPKRLQVICGVHIYILQQQHLQFPLPLPVRFAIRLFLRQRIIRR